MLIKVSTVLSLTLFPVQPNCWRPRPLPTAGPARPDAAPGAAGADDALALAGAPAAATAATAPLHGE